MELNDINNGDIINTVQVVSDMYYKEIGKYKKKRKYRKIKCLLCGNITEARELALKHGKTGQCRHCRSNVGRMKGNPQNHNRYKFINNIGIGYTNNGEQFYFDLEDYDKIKDYCWHINKHGYVETQKNKKQILMHRFILNAPSNKDVDHINRIRCYNLKNNLKIVTKKENNQNNTIYKNNTSGVTGVSFDSKTGLWKSYININGERIYGEFSNDINIAIRSRKQLEQKYFYYLNDIKQSLAQNKLVLYCN